MAVPLVRSHLKKHLRQMPLFHLLIFAMIMNQSVVNLPFDTRSRAFHTGIGSPPVGIQESRRRCATRRAIRDEGHTTADNAMMAKGRNSRPCSASPQSDAGRIEAGPC